MSLRIDGAGPLHRSFFGIAGSESGVGMNAGDAHEEQISTQARSCVDQGGATSTIECRSNRPPN